jgi:hypothetical protein
MGVFPTISLLLFKDKNCIYYKNVFTYGKSSSDPVTGPV